MKFILMGLVKSFTKEMGRSPSIGELKLLRREADMIQQQDKIIPFPGGGKDKVSPFTPKPKPETEAEMLERMNRQNKESVERLKKKKEKDLGDMLNDYDGDPDAMAMGGRAGYAVGGLSKLLKMLQGKVGKKNITTADKIDRPESVLNRQMFEDFNQRNRKLTKDELEDFENEMGEGLDAYDFDGTAGSAERILKETKDYDARMFAEYKAGKLNPDKSLAKAMDEVGGNMTGDLKYDAEVLASELAFQRGLIPEGGDLSDIANQMKQMDLYDEAYSAVSGVFKKQREMRKLSKPTQTLKSIKEKGTIDIGDENVMGEFDTFMREADPEGYADLEQKIELSNFDPKGRKKNAAGGVAYMLGEPRDRLEKGGPPNPGRRNFMKLIAGLASIPVLGKFFKGAKVAKTVVPLTKTTTTMPAWFPSFVDKVIDRGVGTKIDADIMKYEVKELPGIQVTKHDDGRVFVEGKNDYSKSYEIEYEPPGYVVVDEKTGKSVKTKGDFTAQEEVPVNVDPDGNADFDGEILESVDNILSSDARVMEEFATGKKIKEMKRGEFEVGRAESMADAARKGEDFATGGLAKLLGE